MARTRFSVVLLGLTLLAGPALLALAQEGAAVTGPTITGPDVTGPDVVAPTTAQAPATAPATTTEPASTAPSAESMLENLLHTPPAGATTVRPPTSGSPVVTPVVPGVAPNQPEVKRITEGQFLWNRVGRLVKDEKNGEWLFAFEADGEQLKDPPMVIVPSRMLQAMEEATDNGTKSLRFKISGQVLEYRGSNHIWIQRLQLVRDTTQF